MSPCSPRPRARPPVLPCAVGLCLFHHAGGKTYSRCRLAGIVCEGRIDPFHGLHLHRAVGRVDRDLYRFVRFRMLNRPAVALKLTLAHADNGTLAAPAVGRPAIIPPGIVKRHNLPVPGEVLFTRVKARPVQVTAIGAHPLRRLHLLPVSRAVCRADVRVINDAVRQFRPPLYFQPYFATMLSKSFRKSSSVSPAVNALPIAS